MALFEGMFIRSPHLMTDLNPIKYRPLHGIPILIKFNIGTADKMNTTGTWPNTFIVKRDRPF